MEAELAFKAFAYGLIGLLLITMLAPVFASMRKEERWGEPLGGLFWLTLVVLGLCRLLRSPRRINLPDHSIDSRLACKLKQ